MNNIGSEKKLKEIISEAISKTDRLDFKCFVEECPNKAIDSHSQSLSNALKRISENGHVILPRPKFFMKDLGIDSGFQKIGVNRASTFKGFCKEHDNKFFKTVDNIDQNNITKGILGRLAFRTFAYEQRTKERILFLFDFINKNASSLFDTSNMRSGAEGIKNHLDVTKPYYLEKFLKMFESQNYDQIYGVIFLLNKKIPISCATTIDPTLINSENLMEGDIEKPLDMVFFNLIPQVDSSLVIFAYFKEQETALKEFIEKISSLENVVFNHCEEVLMSPGFYGSLSSELKYKIIEGLSPWVLWEKKEFPDLFNEKLESPKYI